MHSNFDLIRVKNFIEKESIFERIDREFRNQNTQFVCLFGAPGSGKTSHALEYARRFIVNTKNLNVYWLGSDSLEKFEIEFKKLSRLFGIKVENVEKNFLIEQTMKSLKQNSNILLVIDDLTNSEQIKDYIRLLPKNIKCIITSRRQLTNKLFKYIKIELFSMREAETYIHKLFKDQMNRKQIEYVLNFLKLPKLNTISPYRLEKCLFYLSNRIMPLETLINNLKSLNTNQTELTLLIGILSSSKFTKAFHMLQYSAWCDHDLIGWDVFMGIFNISLSECQEYAEKIVGLNLAEMIRPLNNTTNNSISLGLTFHSLTQEYILDFVKKFPNICLSQDEIVFKLLFTLNDLLDTKGHTHILHAIKLLQQATHETSEDIEKEKSDLCFKVGLFYVYTSFEYEKAARMFRASYELRCKVFRRDHVSQVDSLKMLALSNEKMGEYKQAIEFYLKAIEIKINLIGSQTDRDIASLFQIVGVCYDKMNDHLTAINYKKKALEVRRDLFKESKVHPDIAKSLYSLALSYQKMENYQMSLEYDLQALKMRQEIYVNSVNNASVAESLHSVASDYEKLSEWRLAFQYYEKAYIMRKESSAPNQAEIAESLHCMAVISDKLNEFERSVAYDNEALEIRKKIFASDHYLVQCSENNLKVGQKKLAQQKIALDQKKELEFKQTPLKNFQKTDEKLTTTSNVKKDVVQTHELLDNQKLNANKKQVQIKQNDFNAKTNELENKIQVSDDLYATGFEKLNARDFANALVSFEKSRDLRRECFNQTPHYSLIDCSCALGKCYDQLGDIKSALSQYKEAHEMVSSLYSEPTPQAAECLNLMGVCYEKCGDYKRALENKLSAHDMRAKLFSSDPYSLELAESYHSLAVTYDSLNEFETAHKYKMDALKIRKKCFGNKPNSLLASSLNNIGVSFERQGKFKEAEEYFQKAFDMRKLLLKDPNSQLDLANSYHNLAVLKEKQNKLDESKQLFLESLKLKEKLFAGANHSELANCLNGLGAIYSKLNDNKKALIYSKRAYEIRLKLYESDFPNHIELQNSLFNLGIVNEKLGRKTEAYEYFKKWDQMKSGMKKESDNLRNDEKSYSKCENWNHEQFLGWFAENSINATILKIVLANTNVLNESLIRGFYELSLNDEKSFKERFLNIDADDLEHFTSCMKKLFELKIKSNFVL